MLQLRVLVEKKIINTVHFLKRRESLNASEAGGGRLQPQSKVIYLKYKVCTRH